MKIYLDNVIASGKVLDDLSPRDEMVAVNKIEKLVSQGRLELFTSRESWREQDRAHDPWKRAKLEKERPDIAVVQQDHEVVGFNHVQDHYGGFIANPLVADVIDDSLFAKLKYLGLGDADARHFMYAACNGCERFVTLDSHFLSRRNGLEAHCQGMRIVKPSELIGEMQDEGK